MPIAIPFIGLLAIAGLAAAAISGSPTASKNTKTIAKGLDKKLNDWQKDAMMTIAVIYALLNYADVVDGTIPGNAGKSFKKNYPPKAATPSLIPTGIPIAAGLIATTLAGHLGTLGQTGDKSISLDTSQPRTNTQTKKANPPKSASKTGQDVVANPLGRIDDLTETGDHDEEVKKKAKDLAEREREKWQERKKREEEEEEEAGRQKEKKKSKSDSRAFSVCCYKPTSRCYIGISGSEHDGEKNETRSRKVHVDLQARVDEVQGELRAVGLLSGKGRWARSKLTAPPAKPRPLNNCGEFNAINNALNDGAKFNRDLLVFTVGANGYVRKPCENCSYLYGEKVTFVNFIPKSEQELIDAALERKKNNSSNNPVNNSSNNPVNNSANKEQGEKK